MYIVSRYIVTTYHFAFADGASSLAVSDVRSLCGRCPHLKELDLSDSTTLTGQSVHVIAGALYGLEYVALSRCYNILPSTLP